MANYDFNSILSPIDFELLVRDLLSREFDIELSAFAEGKDNGVDLRYSQNAQKKIVVQCKRKNKTSYQELVEEKAKIEKLQLDLYYLALSHDITPMMMDKIKMLFGKWMNGDDNIYTRNRLNSLLVKYPDVERRHYKLWLNSSTILKSILNQDLYERSRYLINDIARSYKYYVKNPSLDDAISILNDHRFLIISGMPGIGKTTLAKLLLWEYLQEGYEIIEIKKVSDGEKILVEGSEDKQVFYFDDFLGENFLKYDVIEGRSYDLLQFIQRILNNQNKILIMTTREYIFTQAKDRYEKLNSEELNIYKYTLDLNSYTKRIKALILYNHLYYSGVSLDHIANIINNKTYTKIINHKNYSPRIIEHMTVKLGDIKPENYSEIFIKSLANPLSIWDRAFNSQITDGARYTLYLLLSIGSPILLSDFTKAFEFFYKSFAKKGVQISPFYLKDYLRELEGCFISIKLTNKKNHYIDFQNPSIKDFLLSNLKEDGEVIKQLLISSLYFDQFTYVLNYLAKEIVLKEGFNAEIDSIIIKRFDDFKSHSRIISELELSPNLNTVEKLDKLSYYLSYCSNNDLLEFLSLKFREVDVERMLSYSWAKYISFYKEYKDTIKVKFSFILDTLFKNIRWVRDVKNFASLKSVAPSYFSKFVNERKDEFSEVIINVIRKDTEVNDSKYDLEDLIADIEHDISSLGVVPIEELQEVTSEITEKISQIQENEEQLEPQKISSHSEKYGAVDILYDENAIFKLELFER